MEHTIFYYSDGKSQFGPFSKEEMKTKSIQVDTLIWFDGLAEWKHAGEVPEMKEFLPVAPPPLPVSAPIPVPPPVRIEAAQPPVQSAPQPVGQPAPQPVQPATSAEQSQPARKKFTLLLFIFSIVGVVMSVMLMSFAAGLVSVNDFRDYYNSYWERYDYIHGIENEGWGTFFIFVGIFLLVFSILTCVKMAKQLKKARRNR